MAEEEQQLKRQRAPPPPQPRVPCARCGSGDTKFCYYNNYNTSQPRYYCRTCKRHWTHGGTLRNVPEGGSSSKKNHRKNRNLSPPSSSVAAAADALKLPAQPHMMHAAPAITAAAGIGASLPPLPSFFYNGGGGRASGLVGDELPAFQIHGGGVAGGFPLAPPGLNPLDGISMQRSVQQPRLSLALHHQNLLVLQQLQQQSNTAAPLATADQNQIRRQSNTNMFFNMASSPPQPPPP
ncbi:uncharacterized protein LOC141838327 [Curcuma longa]|uniref:uncharacterized protein LOC141838327 n=1 Tax=Curcuma longa TaxID=136217 RepID=UPI003D9F4813